MPRPVVNSTIEVYASALLDDYKILAAGQNMESPAIAKKVAEDAVKILADHIDRQPDTQADETRIEASLSSILLHVAGTSSLYGSGFFSLKQALLDISANRSEIPNLRSTADVGGR